MLGLVGLPDKSQLGPAYKRGSAGKTSGSRRADYEIDRWHELVVDALHRELKRRGLPTFTSEHNDMKPDLYSVTKDRQLRHLFEAKTAQNTSTLYTAIGQLVVYGAAQARPPKRFLVENPVEDLNFVKALKDQHITIINFRRDSRERITFRDLRKLHQVLSSR